MKKAVAALLLCLLSSASVHLGAGGARIVATPIAIDPADPAHRQIGRLRYLAGWHLQSRLAGYGGYSALAVKGDDVLMLSDSAAWLRFRMATPGTIDRVRLGKLPGLPAFVVGRNNDAESMALAPDGDIWIGFEYQNAIMRYSADLRRVVSANAPEAMRDWPQNQGPEAMVRLRDGRFLIFCEGGDAGGDHPALLFGDDPSSTNSPPTSFRYRPPRGYAPTDAAQLPDGRLVILHRRFGMFDGFGAAVAILDPAGIRPGVALAGQLVAELRPPLNIDNMEGISVTREADRTILWLVSDDNKLPIQRTLLLKFELLGGGTANGAAGSGSP